MKRLDLGQAQFAKLAKTYKLTLEDFKRTPEVRLQKDGRTVAKFVVRGRKLLRRDWNVWRYDLS
jgi:hypothetical protein